MLHNLTEEQALDRDEVFLTILDEFVTENFNVPEDYEMSEEDAYITSILWEHFCENFKWPTLNESVIESVTGRDINQDLFEELADALLDESVGTFVAGAVHGVRNWLSGRKVARATAQKQKASTNFNKYKATTRRTIGDVMQQKHDQTNYGKGVRGNIKKEFQQGKINAIKTKTNAARDAMQAAETRRKSTVGKHQVRIAKSNALARKIDTGIDNIKNKVSSKISSGASALGSLAGRFAE